MHTATSLRIQGSSLYNIQLTHTSGTGGEESKNVKDISMVFFGNEKFLMYV